MPSPALLSRIALSLALTSLSATAFAYEKAVEGSEVVLNKLFPKKNKVELDGRFGIVLNSSYQQTFLGSGSITYFWSEEWGFNVEGIAALVSDKNERKCIETFYNDPNFAVNSAECDGPEEGKKAYEEDPAGDANYGPAYVPIRELKYMFVGNLVWNPIYGKQIVLLSATNYFDFYLQAGGGVAMSDYYPKTPNFADGRPTRGRFCTKEIEAKNQCSTADTPNPGTTDETLVGESGRPVPEAQTNVLAHFAVGQRFHFFKRFTLNASLDNYTLLGTDSGFDTFLVINGGLGVRF